MKIKLSQFKKTKILAAGLLLAVVLLLPRLAGAVEANVNGINVNTPIDVNAPLPADVNQPLVNQPLTNQPVNQVSGSQQPPATGNVIVDGLKKFGIDLNLTDADPRTIAARLIKIALGLVGTVFLLMILLSGLRWMFSGGDEEKVGEAKRTLTNAIIGLVIIFLAYSIVNYVVSALVTTTG